MNTEQAINAVNGMVFKPGWRLLAEHFGHGRIYVTLYIETVDTSYPSEDGTCRKSVTLYRDRMVEVRESTTLEDLCFEVLKLAAEVDVHENREFLKVRGADGQWTSPMHPHTTAGEVAWMTRLYGRKRESLFT